jgi:hypothetical protein
MVPSPDFGGKRFGSQVIHENFPKVIEIISLLTSIQRRESSTDNSIGRAHGTILMAESITRKR